MNELIEQMIDEASKGMKTLVALNNDFTPIDDVIHAFVKATGMNALKANDLALLINNKGEAEIIEAPEEECIRIGKVLDTVRVEYRIEDVKK